MVQYNMVQHSVVQYNAIQYDTQYNITKYNQKYAELKNLSNTYMLYLKNRNSYRHVFGIELFTMSNFVFTFNTFMRLKINAFRVIKEKTHF